MQVPLKIFRTPANNSWNINGDEIAIDKATVLFIEQRRLSGCRMGCRMEFWCRARLCKIADQ